MNEASSFYVLQPVAGLQPKNTRLEVNKIQCTFLDRYADHHAWKALRDDMSFVICHTRAIR